MMGVVCYLLCVVCCVLIVGCCVYCLCMSDVGKLLRFVWFRVLFIERCVVACCFVFAVSG